MGKRQPEGVIVDAITAYVQANGGHFLKIHGGAMQRAGEPDLLGWFPVNGEPVPFAVEVKVPGEYPRPLQWYRLNQWKAGNFATGYATSVEDFKRILGVSDEH